MHRRRLVGAWSAAHLGSDTAEPVRAGRALAYATCPSTGEADTMKLFSSNPDQVSSFSYIEVDLVDPSRKMHIFSGIAIPAFRIDDDGSIHTATCEVDSGIALPDAQQGVAQVGLASIVNNESPYVFAVDNARVEIQGGTGRIILVADLALSGDESAIERFGFQVVVVSGVRSTGVTGLGDLGPVFVRCDGSERSTVEIACGDQCEHDRTGGRAVRWLCFPAAGADPIYRAAVTPPRRQRFLGSVRHRSTAARYSVDGQRRSSGDAFPPGAAAGQINGPRVITLRPSHLVEAGVDFRITTSDVR